ncbi:MAG: hypothetical protein NVS3B5_22280 [Sphingomicrobium sp.]
MDRKSDFRYRFLMFSGLIALLGDIAVIARSPAVRHASDSAAPVPNWLASAISATLFALVVGALITGLVHRAKHPRKQSPTSV